MQLGLCKWKNTQPCVIKSSPGSPRPAGRGTCVGRAHGAGMGQLQGGILLLPQLCWPFLAWPGRKGSLHGLWKEQHSSRSWQERSHTG